MPIASSLAFDCSTGTYDGRNSIHYDRYNACAPDHSHEMSLPTRPDCALLRGTSATRRAAMRFWSCVRALPPPAEAYWAQTQREHMPACQLLLPDARLGVWCRRVPSPAFWRCARPSVADTRCVGRSHSLFSPHQTVGNRAFYPPAMSGQVLPGVVGENCLLQRPERGTGHPTTPVRLWQPTHYEHTTKHKTTVTKRWHGLCLAAC